LPTRFTVRIDGQAPVTESLDSGSYWTVAAEDRCDVLVDCDAGSIVRLDDSALTTFPKGDRVTSVVTIRPERTFGARRIEIRQATGVTRLDVILAAGKRADDFLRQAIGEVERDLPRFRGAFWYLPADRRPRRWVDPLRVAAFIADNGLEISMLTHAVVAEPTRAARWLQAIRPAGARFNWQATLRLLTIRPELLAETAGPRVVERGGKTYGPALVAIDRRDWTTATPEHIRLAFFLRALWTDGLYAVQHAALTDPTTAKATLARIAAFERILTMTFLGELPPLTGMEQLRDPTPLEISVRIYGSLFEHRARYLSDVRRDAAEFSLERRFVPRADEIFQAFSAYAVAAALDLTMTGSRLSRSALRPTFVSPEWRIYFDAYRLRSWRWNTAQPDEYRPDIVIERPASNQTILLDAKYGETWGAVGNERIKEVEAYMHAFSAARIGVLYPAADVRVPTDVAAEGRLIRLIPVSPSLSADALESLRVALNGLLVDGLATREED
jgi:hypothetical protein